MVADGHFEIESSCDDNKCYVGSCISNWISLEYSYR